jgi:Protein of unknown function DUF262
MSYAPPEAADSKDEEERSDAEAAIAEQIVLLSFASDSPTEFEPTGRAFDQSDLDFSSSGWLSSLIEVQGWLHLTEQLAGKDEGELLRSLARGLGLDDAAAAAVETVDRRPQLTAAGLERLSGQLQRAVQLQGEFQADLEADGGSRESATGRWRENWEDEVGEEEGTEPVSARAATWPINEFSSKAKRGRLELSPSYQRGDVWPTNDAQMLIESILRGIPLPSVILLKREGEDLVFEVVDGKQRLTTILRFIGKHPKALEHVREVDAKHKDEGFQQLFDADYPMFRRKWKNLVGEPLTSVKEKELFFPFRLRTAPTALRGELGALQGKYYSEIRDERVRVADDTVEVRDLFEGVTDYKIPLIEYSKATRRQIHEVFNLYNKQGKHLNAEEIRNAVYHDVDFMRGLLVASGDNTDVANVAPFLEPAWDEVRGISGMLKDYGIGSARYRRTKVLSWLASILLVDAMEPGGPRRLSTARHIDSLLERIQRDHKDPLRSSATVREAFLLLARGMEAHSSVETAWAAKFRDTKSGSKWQELQLVASMLGVTLAAVELGEEISDRLEDSADDLQKLTTSQRWQRPGKTQTASQWKYIAEIALWTVEALDVDVEKTSAGLAQRFGASCVPTLRAAAGTPSK